MNYIDCECACWAIVDPHRTMLGNGHHPRCEHFRSDVGALKLIGELVAGIRWWGAQEDGITDEIWEAYRKAVFIVEGRMIEEGKAP